MATGNVFQQCLKALAGLYKSKRRGAKRSSHQKEGGCTTKCSIYQKTSGPEYGLRRVPTPYPVFGQNC
ncbi:hypothetical protein AWENTII_008160 [Aspergillus wentii]